MKIKVIWPLKTAGKRTRESPSKAEKLKIAISSLFCLLFVASLLAGDSCEIVFGIVIEGIIMREQLVDKLAWKGR